MSKPRTLREMRLEKRLTQADVARKGRVSASYYSQVERGKKPSDTEVFMLLVSHMRSTRKRTAGGDERVGRVR
jgi:predicted transcriptional regulator